jgi:hypothetical protein
MIIKYNKNEKKEEFRSENVYLYTTEYRVKTFLNPGRWCIIICPPIHTGKKKEKDSRKIDKNESFLYSFFSPIDCYIIKVGMV